MNLQQVINFAAAAHAGQTRKGKDTPYIAHPFYVALLLTRAGADDETVAAGLLHDYLEDAPGTLEAKQETLLKHFGERVLQLVLAETEDKTKSWEARKTATIERLKATDDKAVLFIACADKAANLHEMRADYKAVGDALWTRFHRDKTHIKCYYKGVINALEKKQSICELDMFKQLKTDYQALFLA